MPKVTKRLVDALVPTGRERLVWDRELPGFGLRQSHAGIVTYVFQYRIEGRQRRYKIGRHGAPWTPETARIEARRLIGEIADGRDPQSWRFECRGIPNTTQLCSVYVEEGMYTCKPSTISCAQGCVENHITPLLGTRRVDTLTRADIERMMRDVAAGKTARTVKKGRRGLARVRGGRGAANNALVILSGALNYAVAQKLRPDNPRWASSNIPGASSIGSCRQPNSRGSATCWLPRPRSESKALTR